MMSPSPAVTLPTGWRPEARAGNAAAPLALLALWLLATIGLRPLMMPDEGRYATVAREMLLGNPWIPTLNGLPFFHKPPLYYWIDMLAMHLFGPGLLAARAGAFVGAWLMGTSLFLAARHWYGERIARIALVVLAGSPMFYIGAQYANHDLLVAGLISLAVLAFARALERRGQVATGWLVLAWVACGLAMLAKGLIGFVLPALAIGPWLLAQRRWRDIPRLFHPLAVLAGLLVALPWFIAMQLRFPAFFDYFFLEQHVRRFAQSHFNNVQPFWFFPVLLPLLTLPWSLFLPRAMRASTQPADPMRGLWLWWMLAVVGFFSWPASKLVGYVMPALVPLALLLALPLARLERRRLRPLAALAAVLCLGMAGGLAWKSPRDAAAVGQLLAAHRAPQDRVVMVDQAFHDVAYHAQLPAPAWIASAWSDPRWATQDNWRKELTDAARFEPARGAEVLRPLAQLQALGCGPSGTWWIAAPAHATDVQQVPGARLVWAGRTVQLWWSAARNCDAAPPTP